MNKVFPRQNAIPGWPVVVAALAFITGILMLAGAAWLQHRTQTILRLEPGQSATAGVTPMAAAPADLLTGLPHYRAHMDDVGLLLRIASEQGVTIRSADYRTEANPSTGVALRVAEVRIDDDYPGIKAFIAELLKRMPHLWLDEIRVDAGGAGKLQASLRLTFAYRNRDE